MDLLQRAPRNLFFTGKGGVGKTSVACATAVALAARGRRVLLVSTDPASNLDEVLQTSLGSQPRPVAGAPGLFALNIDPEAAAHDYRERMVGPYRGVLPDSAVRSMQEQLSGACTVEIAAFDEFSKLLGDEATTRDFDHVVFDTAPTGHTLRLLELPAAWTGYLESNVGGTSCLGPLAGLKAQEALYAASRTALVDGERTVLVLVARAEKSTLAEAERTRRELAELGIRRQELVVNGVFQANDPSDAVAVSMERRGLRARAAMPSGLRELPRTELPLLPFGLVGLAAIARLFSTAAVDDEPRSDAAPLPVELPSIELPALASLLPALEQGGHGVIMTMGKGGVGKKDLDVIRRGILEGRTTFANTLKYVLMTMSANLGNMISMAIASLWLPFLPLLAGQILLNNFLSDIPALGLASDGVDPELVNRPRRWDMRFISRFMLEFGLLSSVFDFLTFGSLLLLHARPELFRSAWFVESLLTEILVALLIRTRRPFFKSRPGKFVLVSTAGVALLGIAVAFLPLADRLGFVPLPGLVLGTLLAITLLYALAVELNKARFYRRSDAQNAPATFSDAPSPSALG
jgi:TRC40/GET3/ArsA family transport-energizing ATPase